MGSSGVGKCTTGKTKITIRNKITKKIDILDFSEFYNKIKFKNEINKNI
jgi:hypothetical protein